MREKERNAEVLLVVVVFIWALNAPFVKFGLQGLNIFVFNSIRYVVAAVGIAVIFRYRSGWKSIAPEDRWRMLRLGLIASVLYQLAYIVGLDLTTAGNSAVLISTAPLWTAFFHARIQKEKIEYRAWVGMTVSLAGIVMMIIGSGKKLEFGSHALLGDLLSVGAAILWGLNTNLQKPLLATYSTLQVTMVSTGVGAVGLTLMAIPAAVEVTWSTVDPVFFVVPVISGALSIAAANVLWSFGVKIIGPQRTAAYNNLVPVIAFIAAYIALNEQVVLIQAVGAAVTVLGVWLARR